MPESNPKTVLITGANRGIGRQLVDDFVDRGCRVLAGTRQNDLSGSPVADIADGGGSATWIGLDVSHHDSFATLAANDGFFENGLDVLINNAGVYPDAGDIADVTIATIQQTLNVNTYAPLLLVRALHDHLMRSNDARVINISSHMGRRDGLRADAPAYCLSKLMLNAVTQMMADRYADDGITINAASPGWTRTDMGGSNAQRDVATAAAGIVQLALDRSPAQSGKFFYDGEVIGW